MYIFRWGYFWVQLCWVRVELDWWTGSWASRQSLSNRRPTMWSRVVSAPILESDFCCSPLHISSYGCLEILKVTLQPPSNHVVKSCALSSENRFQLLVVGFLLVSYNLHIEIQIHQHSSYVVKSCPCLRIKPKYLGFSASSLACWLIHQNGFF